MRGGGQTPPRCFFNFPARQAQACGAIPAPWRSWRGNLSRHNSLPRPCAGAGNLHAARRQILEADIDHRRHQRVGESVVLVKQGQLHVFENAGEGQVDLGARRRVAIFQVIIQPGDFYTRIGQSDADELAHMLVEHGGVEVDVIADQRPSADEMQQIGQDLVDRAGMSDIGFEQAMHLDRFGRDRHARPHHHLIGLTGENAVAANFDRRDGDDFVALAVEAGGLAIDRHHLIRRSRLQQNDGRRDRGA